MENSEHLSGIVDKIVYQSTSSGYTVFVLCDNSQEKITVTGNFAALHAGEELHVKGAWSYHAKFGKQFTASDYSTKLPNSIVGLKKYLGSGLIKGIGPVYAQKLVDHFQEDTLTIIDTTPERLYEVSGIGRKRIDQIIASWQEQKYIAHIIVFLQEKGVSTTYATKIYKTYGKQSIALLTENPYRLPDDIWGVGFKTADSIAQKLGFLKESVQRVKAGILFTIQQSTSIGHIYQELATLKNLAFHLLELDPALHTSCMKQALTSLYNEDKIKLIHYKDDYYITTSMLYHTEKSLANKFLAIANHPSKLSVDVQKLYKGLETQTKIELHEQQIKGILQCFESKISVITGGPGTGKTTLITCLLDILEQEGLSFKLAAPTGRAAKRMMEGTKRYASTIHRLLEFDAGTMGFNYNDTNSLKTDFLIIDEASMIDVFLGNSIMKAVALDTHIVFIGDVDQLPSVGPGNVLRDIIASKQAGCIKLSHIFRQAQNSMIVLNAHKINKGDFPTSNLEGCKRDYYFIKQEDPLQAFDTIKSVLNIKLKEHNISLQDTTILVPMNKGTVGTQNLNYNLQNFLNPALHSPRVKYAGIEFRMNDRVMQIKNNYDKKIFNGDIGTISTITLESQELTINFDGNEVLYQFDELNEITLAYAVTIHKSQGSEYGAVIVPIFMQHFTLLQRNLLYTAITRAKKLCIFIGQSKAIAMGIKNDKTIHRVTFLEKFLTENLACK